MKKSTMGLIALILYFLITWSVLLATNPLNNTGNFYREEIQGVSYFGDQGFQFSSVSNIYIKSYTIQGSGENKTIKFLLIDQNSKGELRTLVQPYKPANFLFNYTIGSDGYPTKFNLDLLYFRDNTGGLAFPYNTYEWNFLSSLKCDQISCRYNRESNQSLFNQNFLFDLKANVDGKVQVLRYNVELSTSNDKNGQTIRTAYHMIVRDSSENILYEISHSFYRMTDFERATNILNQPWLTVPFYFTGAYFFVWAFNESSNYVKKNNIKLFYRLETENKNENINETDPDNMN